MFEKVLVLTNCENECAPLKATLSDYYFIVCAPDVHTALQYIKKNNDVRVLIIDIDTPKLVPEQLLEILSVHALFRKITTIVAAELGQQMRIARLIEAGASDFVTKPLDADSLKQLLDLHISSYEEKADALSNETNVIFDRLFNDAPIGVAITRVTKISDQDKLTSVVMNPAYEQIIGRKRSELQVFDWKNITHPDDLGESKELFARLEKGEIKNYSRIKRYLRPDGSIVWVNLVVTAFDTNNPDVFSYISLVQDVTEQREMSNLLSESERSKSVLLNHLPGLAYRCNYDRDWTMKFVSTGCKELTGYEPEALLENRDLSYNDLIDPLYHQDIWNEWKRITNKKIPFRYEYKIITKSGDRKWVLELGEGVYDNKGQVIALEGIVIDIDYLKRIEEELQHKSDFDTLTELHNRRYFERLINEDIKNKTIKNKAIIGLNFSSIQSLVLSNGYHYGMDIIVKISQVLKSFASENADLFITHENRFCFYIHDYKDKIELVDFYEKIAQALEHILLFERINCGVGILEARDNIYPNADRILKDTLIATERALEQENDKIIDYIFFDKDMQYQIEREKIIKDELLKMSEQGDSEKLYLQYQPVIDLKNTRVASFEALTRFRSERLGIVSPLEFIPLLEKTKLIVPVGEMIASKALKFLKRLNSLNYDVTISINISPIQLLSEDFANRFYQKVLDIGVDPNKIWLEITESIFTNNYQLVNRILGEIMEKGIRVTIDDFGTGYSSLHRVLALNTKGIKIDRAFINGLELIPEDIAITKDIVSLGHKLNYLVVAEGIENEIQASYLKSYDCDLGQGFYFSRPLEEDKALIFLKKLNG